MPKKWRGASLSRKRAKKLVREEEIPSLPADELPLVPVDDVAENEERLPNADFEINDDNTLSILQATSDECPTLNVQASRLAIAYYYMKVLDAPPPEEWDGHDGTVSQIQKDLKFENYFRTCIRFILSQVYHCHCIGTQYTGERNIVGDLGRKVIIKKPPLKCRLSRMLWKTA